MLTVVILIFASLLALLGTMLIIAMPVSLTLRLLFLAGFVVVGPITYFLGLNQVQWLVYLAALLLLLRLVYKRSQPGMASGSNVGRMPLFIWWLVIFLLFVLMASAIDSPRFGELMMSSRWYFFMWPVLFTISLGEVRPQVIEHLWRLLLLIALFQLPMALFQFQYVSMMSLRASPWDAVVGTFPGHMDGGGQSAAMGIFLLIMMLLSFALWRKKIIGGRWPFVLVIAGIATLALAEVKAAVLLLPVVVALYYRREVIRHPIQSVFLSLFAISLVVGLFSAYEVLHYSHQEVGEYSKYGDKNTLERVLSAIDPENENEYGYSLGRITHLVFWWKVNGETGDFQHTLFGYGMGATAIASKWIGEVAETYSFPMDTTSSTILLWETGLVGHVLFIIMLVTAALSSAKLSRHRAIPDFHRVALDVGAVALVILVLTLPYHNFTLRSVPISLLLMLILGQTSYWWRYTKMKSEV